ncbi:MULTISPECIES: radical SAM/SPASM domain-containing protein [Blautia]|uniref:radical SAM/SPASM domain-containing protein n=1 Tax=Blautia TaxID=572511 RepID=UPI000BA3C19E|nr:MULTISPECIES: radical SAM protein [Blautia]
MKRTLEHVYINITNRCNNNCLYCFQGKKENITELTYNELIDVFAQLKEMNVNRVTLSGGEPTVHPNFFDIIRALEEKNIEVNVLTNALFDKEVRNFINNSNINKIYVSLDGTGIENYITRGIRTMDNIIENLKLLEKKITVMCTVNNYNYRHVDNLISFCSQFSNVKKINFNPIKIFTNKLAYLDIDAGKLEYMNEKIDRMGNGYNIDIRSYYNKFQNKYMNCKAGKKELTINYNGDISPCIFGFSIDPPIVMGSIKNESIKTIWEGDRRWEEFLDIKGECKKCNNSYYCSGICKIEEIIKEGDKCKYLCSIIK